MITGDNPLTACHVARELGMLHDNKQTLMLQHKPHSGQLLKYCTSFWRVFSKGVSLPHCLCSELFIYWSR